MMIIDPFEGYFRRMVERQMSAPVPDTLCRVVYETPKFDINGYLSAHRSWHAHGSSIPLAHPNDWETIARFLFQKTKDHFMVLEIDSSKIKNIKREPHPLLGLGEFFARVPRDAIVGTKMYCWNEDEYKERLPHLSEVHKMQHKEFLSRSYAYVPCEVY